MSKLLTEKELQEKLKLSRSTIVRLRKEGLPYKKLSARCIRYDEAEVNKWLNARSN